MYLSSAGAVLSIFLGLAALTTSAFGSIHCGTILVKQLRDEFLSRHTNKENLFWADHMALASKNDEAFQEAEAEMQRWSSDPENLPRIRRALTQVGLSANQETALRGWQTYFEAHAVENPQANEIIKKLIAAEVALHHATRTAKVGYVDPSSGEFKEASLAKLRNMIDSNPSEQMRKAAWEGFAAMEQVVLKAGFRKIVELRNQLAWAMGYPNYYEYKLWISERLKMEQLFAILDDLERNTRDVTEKGAQTLAQKHGEGVREPWNFNFFISGSLKKEMDPYFQFDSAVARWGRSFAALGINYNGATLRIDLVDRDGKYPNGFAHAPFPGFVDENGYRSSVVNFTANAVPGQIGAGKTALTTLFHEGGHAAHFSNIMMPSPSFSQEFAPTSIAGAEIHSMFLDDLIGSPLWQSLYAKNAAGESIPRELIRRSIEATQPYAAVDIRKMLIMPFFERELYSLPDHELTDEKILAIARRTEESILPTHGSTRPLLCFPHVWSRETSAYYHGYILATLGVDQTRHYFERKYGFIANNPKVGPELAEKYWKPGNSKTPFEFVPDLTGEPFSAKATIARVNQPVERTLADVDAQLALATKVPVFSGPIHLNAKIYFVHGDQEISSTETDSFEVAAEKYAKWIRGLSQ